jgi:transaldolase
MKATQQLHRAGQSLWLDNITRDLLSSGTLKRYIEQLSVTGLTSNPTIFDQAIKNGTAYDSMIRDGLPAGKSGENLFFEIALEDMTWAADLFRAVHERTSGVDGWVSLESRRCSRMSSPITIASAYYRPRSDLVSRSSRHPRSAGNVTWARKGG